MTTPRRTCLTSGAVSFLLLLLSSGALAAEKTKLVRYACEADRIVVTLVYETLAEGAQPESDVFDPYDLIVVENGYAIESKTVERTCTLSDGDYVVEIEGVNGNYNIEGRCGAWSTARVAIRRGEQSLFDEYLESHCHDYDGTVIDRVEIVTGAPPNVRRVGFEEFNDW